MKKIYLNNDWQYRLEGQESWEDVRIPHSMAITPFNYFSEECYQGEAVYQKTLTLKSEELMPVMNLTFEGVAHDATLCVNDKKVGRHLGGYTAFTYDIRPYLKEGDNTIEVKVDSRENLNIPPFGNVIDYMTYGGIYREVYLEGREEHYIKDLYVTTQDVLQKECKIHLNVELNDDIGGQTLNIIVKEKTTGDILVEATKQLQNKHSQLELLVKGHKLWDLDTPHLYDLTATMVENQDQKSVTFGFREAIFTDEGFLLNKKSVKIRGLNRHQSYPYVGYAMPKSQQEQDVHILKYELGLNAVRTSHYPQSQHFINRCDELGLLVFTELPGWQHIGDEAWKETAKDMVKEMVLQYRNHPSIILWGVRINESFDDDTFYQDTNAIAKTLDPSRQTGGVRCIKNSKLLEDVYTYNDFVHTTKNQPLEKKGAITKEKGNAYLVSEYMGHMYPTKSYDTERIRVSHAMGHANIINQYYKDQEIAGGFGWCMFDYNTHKDFGSGDKICHHGVMDMFRNPKLAAAVYQSQQDSEMVLKVTSSMDIGEYPGCKMGKIYAITNADSVKIYKNDQYVTEVHKEQTSHKHMPHGPIELEDLIGDLLETNEHFKPKKAKLVKQLLQNIKREGVEHMSIKTKILAARLILFYGMKYSDGYELFQKYVGNWGEEATIYTFQAIKDGQPVKTIKKEATIAPIFVCDTDRQELVEGHTYDVAAVRIRACDAQGEILSYYQEPLTLEANGGIEIVGPKTISLKGGMGGTYVRTTGTKVPDPQNSLKIYANNTLIYEETFHIKITE